METYIKKAEDLEAVNNSFMPPLLDAILGDYNRNVPAARDAEVLNVMATITARLGVCRLFCHALQKELNLLILLLATSYTSSPRYPRCRFRTYLEHDQSGLCRVP